MIGTRTGVVAALLLSLGALALGIAALMANVRRDDAPVGRLVQTRMTNASSGDPVLFPVDDFYASVEAGKLRALYVYPPGYFGQMRGCRVVWDSGATLDRGGRRFGPGLFIDPCSGARFGRDGALLEGPADRGLDEFPTTPTVDGILVDTRHLRCGALPASTATPARDETAQPTPTPRKECPRVSPNGTR
jgi:hypothetical protein